MEIIKIYDSEIKDGLEKSIANNTTVICSKIKEIQTPELIISKAGVQDVGLFHIPSILASVGWNQNTDVFTPEDSWNAEIQGSTFSRRSGSFHHKGSSRLYVPDQAVSPDALRQQYLRLMIRQERALLPLAK